MAPPGDRLWCSLGWITVICTTIEPGLNEKHQARGHLSALSLTAGPPKTFLDKHQALSTTEPGAWVPQDFWGISGMGQY